MQVADEAARGDLVIKIAILAERYPPSLAWYASTMVQLLDAGGDAVGDDVWHRAVHLMSSSAAMRGAGQPAMVARLQGGSFSVPLISAAGCASAHW